MFKLKRKPQIMYIKNERSQSLLKQDKHPSQVASGLWSVGDHGHNPLTLENRPIGNADCLDCALVPSNARFHSGGYDWNSSISFFNASFTIAPHIFAYGFVCTLNCLATSFPYRPAWKKSWLAISSRSSLLVIPRSCSGPPLCSLDPAFFSSSSFRNFPALSRR